MIKLEDIFTQLQISILKKIGEYGSDIKNISNEMVKTQESFSKILNPLTDNIRELKRISDEKNPSSNLRQEETKKDITKNTTNNNLNNKKRTSSINKNPSFDDYLR